MSGAPTDTSARPRGQFRDDLRLSWRLARRELRGGIRGFRIFLLCLALGVSTVAAVGELSWLVEASLAADARRILGGDLEFRRSHLPLPQAGLELIRSKGQVSRSVSLRAMAHVVSRSGDAPADGPPAALVELKAVDNAYPLVGAVTLASGRPLAEALAPSGGLPGAVVANTLLQRLNLRPGDTLRVGKTEFRVTDVLVSEPDRTTSLFSLGPRLLMNMADIESTELLGPASLSTHAATLVLSGPSDRAARERVKEAFLRTDPDSGVRVRDFTEAGTRIKTFMDSLTRYLTLVGLLSLLVAGIGVANAVDGYLERKASAIATMKCLGAARRQIIWTYLLQTLTLAGLGSLIGLLVGWLSMRIGAPYVLQLLGLAPPEATGLALGSLATGLGYGLLVTLLFSLRPLFTAAEITPARLFRGYADNRAAARGPAWKLILAMAAVAASVLALTLVYAGATRVVWGFAACVVVAMLLFRLFSRGLLYAAARVPRPEDPRLRQAVMNVHRPGSRAPAVIFSLGLGLAALSTVTSIDGNLQALLRDDIPAVAPAYFFLDIPSERIDEFRSLALSTAGVDRVESEPALRGRITHVGNVPVGQAVVDPSVQWALRGDRSLTYAARPPRGSNIIAGEWWPETYAGEPLICLAADLAKGFGLGVGDSITINVFGRQIAARIACIREIVWTMLALNHAIVFAPGALEKAPHSYLATVYVAPEGEDALFRTVIKTFPDVAAIYVKDVLTEVESILGKIGLAIRAVAALTLAIGLLVLAETLRANLQSRHYEAVIVKVLGATRADILVTLIAEFLAVGSVTALLSMAIGALGSWAFVTLVMNQPWRLLPLPLLAVGALGLLATLGLGLAGVRSTLNRKAWPVLRNE